MRQLIYLLMLTGLLAGCASKGAFRGCSQTVNGDEWSVCTKPGWFE